MTPARVRYYSLGVALALVAHAGMVRADFPNHNGAPGSQPGGDSTPFSAVASQPGADLFTGTASTEIAIEVPPGRLDMTPKLELKYSSSGGRSPFGYGWNLSVGRISRSTRFGVPAYDNQTDRFVLELSGTSTELVAIPGTKRYRAKIEGGFVRIGFDAASNYWKIIDKHGTSFIFGRVAAQSRLGPDTSTSSQTFAWLLEKVEDTFGNTIEYLYEEALPGETSPPGLVRQINYGGTSDGLEHIFEVRFNWYYPWGFSPPYHSRPNVSYNAGFEQVIEARLLSTIETYAEGQLARTYELTQRMEQSSGVILLESVGLRAEPLSVDVPESVFTYAPAVQLGFAVGTNRTAKAIRFASPGRGSFRDTVGNIIHWDTFDINGDGLVDWVEPRASDPNARVRFGTGHGFEPPSPWVWPTSPPAGAGDIRFIRIRQDDGDITGDLFDITGDGLPDLVVTTKFAQSAGHPGGEFVPCGGSQADPQDPSLDLYVYWCVYENTGDGFDLDPILWPAPPTGGVIRNIDGGSDLWQDVVDLNGDGLPDLVNASVWSTADPYWQVYMNTGIGFDIVDPENSLALQDPVLWSAPADRLSQVDKNGGRLNTRWGLSDINGDGLVDFVRASTTSVAIATNATSAWDVYLNTGAGFASTAGGSPSHRWQIEGAPQDATWLHTFYTSSKTLGADTSETFDDFVDVTGDGLPDIIRSYGDWDAEAGIPRPTCQADACPSDGSGPVGPECCQMNLVFVNTGSSFLAPVGLPAWGGPDAGPEAFRYYSNNSSPNNDREFDLFDFDGDGLIDLVERVSATNAEEWHVYRNPASPEPVGAASVDPYKTKPNLMVSLMNGLGGETTLAYTPVSLMGDNRCHADTDPGDGNGVSGLCLPFPYWAVTSVTIRDMFANTPDLTTSYAYLDAYYDADEREFRGFGLAWEVDPAGITTARYYHQDLTCSGRILESDVLGSPGPGCPGSDFANPDDPCSPWQFMISRTLNTWPCQAALADWNSSDPTPVLLASTTSTPYRRPNAGPPLALTDISKTTSYQYDHYGNEVRRTISSPLAGSFVTESEFEDTTVVDAGGIPDEYVVSRPTQISSWEDVNQDGIFQASVDQRLQQKNFSYTLEYAVAASQDCREWSSDGQCSSSLKTVRSHFLNGLPQRTAGPGHVRTTTLYDAHRLYPLDVIHADKLHVGYQDYDYRIGKPRIAIDKDGQTTEAYYDGLGRLALLWGPGATWPEQPDTWISYTYPDVELGSEGSVVRNERGSAPTVAFFDGLGRVIAKKTYVETYDDALGQDVIRTQISDLKSYDAFGRVHYSALAFDVSDADPSIYELNTTFASSPLLERGEIVYDDHTGRVEQTWMPGPQPSRSYEEFERSVPGVRASTDASGLITIEYFDGLDRLLHREHCAIMPDLAADQHCPQALLLSRTTYTYDGLDRLTSVGMENLETGQSRLIESNVYDGLGNKTSMTVVDAGTWDYTYDATSGLLVEINAPNGDNTRLKYGRNRKVKVARIVGLESSSGSYKQRYRYYRRQGELGAGRLERVRQKHKSSTGPTRFSREYAYDHRGRVTSEKIAIASPRPGGKTGYTFHYTYDVADRIIATSYPARGVSGTTVDEAIFTDYSAYGRIKRVYSATTDYVANVGYDFFGNITRVDYGNNVSDLYRYLPGKENGYLECIRTTTDPTATPNDACSADPARDFRTVRYSSRDLNGRIKRIDDLLYPIYEPFSDYHDATYDVLGRLETVAYTAGAAVEEIDTFAYDSIGRITARNDTAYTYSDPTHPHRLTSIVGSSGTTTFAYDGNGSRTNKGSTSYLYDGAGRLEQVRNGTALLQQNSYDENGQRIVRFDASSAVVSHYYGGHFEVEGDTLVRHFYLGGRRIASERIQAPRDLSLAATTALVPTRPGPDGNRSPLAAQGLSHPVARVSTAEVASWAGTTAFILVLIGLGLALVILPGRSRLAAATAALYALAIIPIPGPARLVGSANITTAEAQDMVGQLFFYHADHLDSPRAITNRYGDLVELIRYDVLGKVRGVYEKTASGDIVEKTSGVSTNLTFTGHEPDEETSLIYFGKRFYDPEVGYFLSIDPALQFASPYNYGGYDPLDSIDRDGALFSFATAFFVAALFAGASVIDSLARGGDLGAALTAGAFAFGTSLFASMSLHVVSAAFSGLSALQTLRVAYAGFGLYQTFKEGNIATGLVSLGLAAFGPPGDEAAENRRNPTGSGVSSGGVPAGDDGFASLERSAAAGGTRGETVTVLVEEPDPASATKLGRKGMTGHSGIAIGEAYYDYGPQPGEGANLLGSKGRPWWDSFASPNGDANLGDVLNYIRTRAKTVDIFSHAVSGPQANALRGYWDSLYADFGTYHFAGRQCTSTVAASLRAAGLGNFRALKPTTLAEQLRRHGWEEW